MRKANKQTFKEELGNYLSPETCHYVEEIDDSEEPYYDALGRATYFTAQVGGQTLPIYQTGSMMFETAVLEDSDIAIYWGNVHRNGAVLQKESALFLAKFVTTLIHYYNQECKTEKKDSTKLDYGLYETSLDKALKEFSVEDLNEHGRLLLLKQKLMSYIPDAGKKNLKRLAMF